jgi:hypothetical protein
LLDVVDSGIHGGVCLVGDEALRWVDWVD